MIEFALFVPLKLCVLDPVLQRPFHSVTWIECETSTNRIRCRFNSQALYFPFHLQPWFEGFAKVPSAISHHVYDSQKTYNTSLRQGFSLYTNHVSLSMGLGCAIDLLLTSC
jgi:hypothetical protein